MVAELLFIYITAKHTRHYDEINNNPIKKESNQWEIARNNIINHIEHIDETAYCARRL